MQDLMKADIFFFVTTIAVILVAIGVSVGLYYIVRILRNVRDVTNRVDEGSKMLAEDLGDLRTSLKRDGFVMANVARFMQKGSRWFSRRPPRKAKEE